MSFTMVKYLGPSFYKAMFTLQDSSWVDTKTISERASVHTKEQWFRRDFCNGAKSHIQIGVYAIKDSVNMSLSQEEFLSSFMDS